LPSWTLQLRGAPLDVERYIDIAFLHQLAQEVLDLLVVRCVAELRHCELQGCLHLSHAVINETIA
jgi:hypothetical protein